ncbi:MAG TPA: hypothetical protein VJL32_03855 [Candidatus Paceibacterota bacterium]
MKTLRALASLVVVVALVLTASACGGTPTSPGEVPTPPPSMPPQALVPPGTNTVTTSWIEVKPAQPTAGQAVEIIAWVYTPPGQGGMKPFSDSLVCNGQTKWSLSGNANTEVGYSSGRGTWVLDAGPCTYTSTTSGSTKSLDFVVR